jgi:hypothetical protein
MPSALPCAELAALTWRAWAASARMASPPAAWIIFWRSTASLRTAGTASPCSSSAPAASLLPCLHPIMP